MIKCIEDKGVNSSGYNKIRRYFVEIGYAEVFDWFYSHNIGKANGYHNNTHTFNVVELVKQYCDSKNMGESRMRVHLVAALFHDFCHSGGKLEDSENISIALNGLRKMMEEVGLTMPLTFKFMLPLDRVYAFYLIDSTKYPYKGLNIDKFAHLRVIREADILSYEHKKWKKYVYEGLCSELGLKKEEKQENLNKLLDFHKDLLEKEVKLDFFKKLKDKHYPSFEKDVFKELKK